MSSDPTSPQDTPQRRRSQEMSCKRTQPPTQVPGYEPQELLGVGAYGEVWVAMERNTGRRVAIKFYAHRGGLDWSLLSREVEKLAFLFADRYVVQLIGVGWDSDPPYYIMEYVEQGSLADRLQSGPLPVAEAVGLFHDVAAGLVHAHGKGVLHCDLKPGNVLLDQDNRPRLADFGQSRFSDEQLPALGTLFYMAPEQADLKAVPEVRWDVYALGALLYCMLTGSPPHRTKENVEQLERSGDLPQRLSAYQRIIRNAPLPSAHRQVDGVDRPLAEIVDCCLNPDPKKRYPNVQAVIAALDARAARRAMRPMMVLGAVGPALLLLVVSIFAWWGFSAAVQDSGKALTQSALGANFFAARSVARNAAYELERRYRAVEQVASRDELRETLAEAAAKPEMRQLAKQLSDPDLTEAELAPLRRRFRRHPDRLAFQRRFSALIPPDMEPSEEAQTDSLVASWFFCDADGLSTARVPESLTIGKNFAWRNYFHGGSRDHEESWRPEPGRHLQGTELSAVFPSQATGHWTVAVATPVFDREHKNFLGVVALTIKVGRLVELQGNGQPFAVLVDRREGDHKGLILQHPLFDKLLDSQGELPDRFQDYRVSSENLPNTPSTMQFYRDPLAADPEGGRYDTRWLARMEEVSVRGRKTGWVVIVQEAYESAIGSTLRKLKARLVRYGVAAGVMVVLVVLVLWGFVIRLLKESGPSHLLVSPGNGTGASASSATDDLPTKTYEEAGIRDQGSGVSEIG